MSDKAKNWIRLCWYGLLFLLAVCFGGKAAHGWSWVWYIAMSGLFYNEASKAFNKL
jgi:hypothetical protein